MLVRLPVDAIECLFDNCTVHHWLPQRMDLILAALGAEENGRFDTTNEWIRKCTHQVLGLSVLTLQLQRQATTKRDISST